MKDASIDLILTTASFRDMLQEKLKKANENLRCVSVNTLESVDFVLSETLKEINRETIGLIQYTSGSISKPKGIMMSHNNILMGVKVISEHFEINQQDIYVTWLPCYHSMGLIANIITPIFCNFQCVMLNAEDIVRQPIRWLEAIDKYSGTISGAPNFGYELCIKCIKPEQCENLNLSKLRVAFCGSEKVNKDTIENFMEKFSKYQLIDSLISPCYGLSEATLLVSLVPSKETARSMCINDIPYVSCGKIASDVILKIVNSESKTECEENEIGEVWIAGDVVTKGYFNKLDETEQVYHNKLNGIDSDVTYLNTGDLGFINNGELFITGRKKNMMIFSGKNYFCEDIESIIEKEMLGMFTNGCISFSCDIEGTEKLVIVQGIHKNFLQKYNISDLTVNQVYEIGGNIAESVTKYNNTYWVAYYDAKVIRNFDLNFNLIKEYSLPIQGTPPYEYSQGAIWEDNNYYVNMHGNNYNSDLIQYAQMQKFSFNGTDFTYVESIAPPTNGCSQGITKYKGYYFWNDRPNNMIVISKSIKRGNVYAEVIPIQSEFSYKPTLLNDWEIYDPNYDRTARVTSKDGIVYLSGLIKNENISLYDGQTPIFTLPSHLTPRYSMNFTALSNVGILRLAVVGKNSASPSDQIGNVDIQNILSFGSVSWVSLDGIIYPLL
jgi:hypothetical protein